MIFSFNNDLKENLNLYDDLLTTDLINEIEEMLSQQGKIYILIFNNYRFRY